nr:unnamed protein product [Digitaria exilis]
MQPALRSSRCRRSSREAAEGESASRYVQCNRQAYGAAEKNLPVGSSGGSAAPPGAPRSPAATRRPCPDIRARAVTGWPLIRWLF